MRIGDRLLWGLGRNNLGFEGLRVPQPLRDGPLSEGAEPGEGVLLVVVPHLHHTLLVSLLLLFQADGEGAAHRMTEPLPRVPGGEEPVTQPPSGRPVPTDVREPGLVVPVRGAEGDLLYGLVQHQALGLQVRHSQPVSGYVQVSLDRSPLGIFQIFQSLFTHLHSSGLEHLKCWRGLI